jgi:ureidoglycolate hydrolase
MSTRETATTITAIPLTREAYKPYGSVIGADDALPWKPANMGTSRRFNHLADVENLRADKAKLNLCVFSTTALKTEALEMKLLEKHAHSTQVFLPMHASGRYLVIVCGGDDKPDLSTLGVFIAEGPQGISYYPGVWHYPMTSLGDPIDFACLVYEDGTREDCTVHQLDESIEILFE